MDMFVAPKLTKIQSFQKLIREQVLNKLLIDNKAVLEFTYSEGHLPAHAADCLRQMKKDKFIRYEGVSPLVTYDNVYKTNRIIQYKIL